MAVNTKKDKIGPIRKVWEDYQSSRLNGGNGQEIILRNQLIERYLTIVKYNAERIYAKLPDEVELDDLISAGTFGLIDAINAFDLSRDVKFETYCAPRIRGSILDELRSMDWVPRLVRSRAHKLNNATKELEAEYGKSPSDEQIAEKMDLSNDDYVNLKRNATAIGLVSLSRKWFETDSQKDVCEIDVLEDEKAYNPFDETNKKDLRHVLINGLTRAEKLIVVLYYHEELTMKEIGATLDLSESRVSQMHSSILARMKSRLDYPNDHILGRSTNKSLELKSLYQDISDKKTPSYTQYENLRKTVLSLKGREIQKIARSYLMKGMDTQQISKKLKLKKSTVKSGLTRIGRDLESKLGNVNNGKPLLEKIRDYFENFKTQYDRSSRIKQEDNNTHKKAKTENIPFIR